MRVYLNEKEPIWWVEKSRHLRLHARCIFPLSEKDAYRHAIWGDQDAIFDVESLTEISTKDENNRPKLPADFGESVEQVLKQRPSDLGTAAERSFRESAQFATRALKQIEENLRAYKEKHGTLKQPGAKRRI